MNTNEISALAKETAAAFSFWMDVSLEPEQEAKLAQFIHSALSDALTSSNATQSTDTKELKT